jgi:hypothetical protein
MFFFRNKVPQTVSKMLQTVSKVPQIVSKVQQTVNKLFIIKLEQNSGGSEKYFYYY